MNLSDVKLVVTDMDGTLLNSNHEVSSLFFELFNKMKSHNILFVAASGRPLYGILNKLHKIKDDIIIVAENGGLILKNEDILLSTPINNTHLKTIDALIKKMPDANPVFCTKDKAYTNSKSKQLLSLLSEYYSNYQLINTIDEIKEPIYKIAFFHEENSEKYLYPHLKHLETSFKVKVSANHWVDISENNANKGYAINLLQKKYNITPEQTLVFGDYNNDIEMLKAAYHSYAMKNAHPLVKKTARFMTKSNDENGVEYILDLLVKEKETTRL